MKYVWPHKLNDEKRAIILHCTWWNFFFSSCVHSFGSRFAFYVIKLWHTGSFEFMAYVDGNVFGSIIFMKSKKSSSGSIRKRNRSKRTKYWFENKNFMLFLSIPFMVYGLRFVTKKSLIRLDALIRLSAWLIFFFYAFFSLSLPRNIWRKVLREFKILHFIAAAAASTVVVVVIALLIYCSCCLSCRLLVN